ncbi:MAG: hypothetical protein HGA45_33265 [Chloroflexales bacterium]|nr:hypothetical protein [Chloroflexales bacterium]
MTTARRLAQARGGLLVVLLALLLALWAAQAAPTLSAAPDSSRPIPARGGARPNPVDQPHPTIQPFVRPDLARRLEALRPTILAAARRHNRPELSGMTDAEFAAVIAVVIYNENFGWLEDDIAPLRIFTPLYQDLQRQANEQLPGSNFSVWPTNLRPSVALEILDRQLPLADSRVISVTVTVEGSRIDPADYTSREALFAAITAEISRDDLAVAYLAANLERGLYRASLDGAPVSWRTLAAWHNQGIVDPRLIRFNPTARDYVRRASAYLPLARALVAPRAPRPRQAQGV